MGVENFPKLVVLLPDRSNREASMKATKSLAKQLKKAKHVSHLLWTEILNDIISTKKICSSIFRHHDWYVNVMSARKTTSTTIHCKSEG